ncbi:MAG TPA: acyl-CoA dehydrogenase family protein [Pseudonocardiaceae bacterium]|jgi:alkylation response protein AidB-like acyl-CoA dehydrogenase|nr:acyl-CoA dehydrogenase family protein [Pseudonocardiaceae bacterium]
MSAGLALLNQLAGTRLLDRLGLRTPVRKAVYQATKTGFRTAAAANRTFRAAGRIGKPARLPAGAERTLFDLTPTDEQQMIADAVTEFAAEQLRPRAADADTACAAPDEVFERAAELGIPLLGVPESLGGVATERSTTTSVLVAEAMAHGDMGLAVACLAPAAVSTALALWGDADQQATYLPAFVGENAPAAALAVLEPRPLFDPFTLATKARRTAGGFVLDGVKSLVPMASSAELFVVAAELEGRGPALFLVESGGASVESDPSMGLRAAGMGRLVLENVRLPERALLASGPDYADCVRLSRLGWCALAVGTARAVLDYVIPYVNDRVAFGEPVSHRQGVAFRVADIGIELEGMRLVTLRAAARAEQGQSFAREVALARKLCVDKGMAIGSDGVQLLGGHGYVKEHPVERWYRDLRAVGVAEGVVLV